MSASLPPQDSPLRPSPSARRRFPSPEAAATAYAAAFAAIVATLADLSTLMEDAPAPSEDFEPNWSHVGTLSHVNCQLAEVLATVAEFVNTP